MRLQAADGKRKTAYRFVRKKNVENLALWGKHQRTNETFTTD